MQLYAFDTDRTLISANHAKKHTDYYCLECHSLVRLRGGMHRQKHFYHVSAEHHCSLQGKSMEHLQVQIYLQRLFSSEDCVLECRFPEINRIADVVWKSQKIVFEVQCSPISASEVHQRSTHYRSIGYEIVWILHDRLYNGFRMTAAEQLLKNHTHYFTNIDHEGMGYIYDRYAHHEKGIKTHSREHLKVDLSNRTDAIFPNGYLPREILHRKQFWKLSFKGDLLCLPFETTEEATTYINQMRAFERSINGKKSVGVRMRNQFYKLIIRPYFLIFQMLIEKASR